MPDKNAPLLEALRGLAHSNKIPLHMPGHHRAVACLPPELPYALDATEIPGLDDLRHPEGLLRDMLARIAAIWGGAQQFCGVNGSTGAILAAIYACCKHGDTVFAARNCHKSVFHAIELCGLHPVWLEPAWLPVSGLCGSLAPAALQRAFAQFPAPALCILTSPTYEGILSDVAALAAICHTHRVPLLVDEAHGAHLDFAAHAGFPAGAVRCGADLVVQSLHKTLPALGQTALLHRQGDLIDPARLAHAFGIFQTSSPSYPLLASVDWLCAQPETQRLAWMRDWRSNLKTLRQHLAPRLLPHAAERENHICHAIDPSKLPLDARAFGMDGATLANALRGSDIEPEYALGHITLLMTSCLDTPESFACLTAVLERLRLPVQQPPLPPHPPPAMGAQVLPPGEAILMSTESVAKKHAAGRISSEYVWCCPPGIPLLAPGQRVTRELIDEIRGLEAAGCVLRQSRGANGALCVTQ
ncbi:MAG: aminotransferase class I/II-fold pyridoxal phosphate-dependent enzyme [Oscillospiraceae bacterium]|jgi:arginine/lysine/ornithine decarboxylase|nr:aminotransferase class I/II-fold pyridoxal phosphate-dependent enzyme [Oscillospiraceae bacterium]